MSDQNRTCSFVRDESTQTGRVEIDVIFHCIAAIVSLFSHIIARAKICLRSHIKFMHKCVDFVMHAFNGAVCAGAVIYDNFWTSARL